MRLRYLHGKIKRTMRLLPRMVLQAIMLMAVIGIIAFCGVLGTRREPLAVRAEIAVAAQEENRMTQMALHYVENMESVSQICHFRRTTKEEGFALLEEGEAAALILLPEQMVEGIMNGANPTVDIYFPEYAGLEALLFRELTEAGEGLLRVAQAQIYGIGDTARAYGLTEDLSRMEAQIDSYNLAFALDRLALYDTEQVSAFGSMNAAQFYLSSGIVLFLLLSGMALYPVMQKEETAFRRQLERKGVGKLWQSFCQWICGVLCLGLFAALLFSIVGLAVYFGPDAAVRELTAGAGRISAGARLGIAALIVVTAASFLDLLHSLAGSRTGGILLVFLASVVMLYLSGGLVPALFMPKAVQEIGEWLPTAWMIRAAGGLLGCGGTATGECIAALCGYTALCGGMAGLLYGRER